MEEDNRTYEIEVLGYEKAFVTFNEGQGATATALFRTSQEGDDVVDDNMWDEGDDGAGESKDEADVRSENLALARMVTELEAMSSFQEDQIVTFKAQLVKLRVTSQQ